MKKLTAVLVGTGALALSACRATEPVALQTQVQSAPVAQTAVYTPQPTQPTIANDMAQVTTVAYVAEVVEGAVEDEVEIESWRVAFAAFLNDYVEIRFPQDVYQDEFGYDIVFGLHDFNGDGVPELIIQATSWWSFFGSSTHVYQYIDGQIEEAFVSFVSDISHIDGEEMFVIEYFSSSHAHEHILVRYRFANNSFIRQDTQLWEHYFPERYGLFHDISPISIATEILSIGNHPFAQELYAIIQDLEQGTTFISSTLINSETIAIFRERDYFDQYIYEAWIVLREITVLYLSNGVLQTHYLSIPSVNARGGVSVTPQGQLAVLHATQSEFGGVVWELIDGRWQSQHFWQNWSEQQIEGVPVSAVTFNEHLLANGLVPPTDNLAPWTFIEAQSALPDDTITILTMTAN